MAFEEFCIKFNDLLKDREKSPVFFQEGQALLSGLMADTGWFTDYLQKLMMDTSFRDQQKPSRWVNEYMIYRNPDRSFVILAYIWEPEQADVIHDHNSWGIVGILSGKTTERKYRRTDNGTRDGYAELEETASRIMNPCDTTVILPLDRGIHQMENFENYTVSIHVYGRSVRKGFLNYYYPEKKTVTRIYTYPLNRAALAIRALGSMNTAGSGNILHEVMNRSNEEILKKEIELTLIKPGEGHKA